jgi:transposase
MEVYMNLIHGILYTIWNRFQGDLFPWLGEEIGELTQKQQLLVEVLELAQIERHIADIGIVPGRPQADRCALARAFIAKAVYNMPTTEYLLDRLKSDIQLRRICGWERKNSIPSSSTFSRAFSEFADSHLAERVHEALIKEHLGEQLIGHVSRDSTAIEAREKPVPKVEVEQEKTPKKRGRPKKGEERPKTPTRLEKQSSGISVNEMYHYQQMARNK